MTPTPSTDKTDDGGTAFPVPYSNEPDGPAMMPTFGMTLRDYFAAKALPAVVSMCTGDTRKESEKQADYFARVSYELADAMLKARKQ